MDPLDPSATSSAGGDACDKRRAQRDEEAVLARAAADEMAAAAARARYRNEAMPSLPPDDRIGPLLGPDERVVAVRASARLERRQPAPGMRAPLGLAGALYVTSRRLVLVGRLTLAYELEAIEEAVLSDERLLLVLHDGRGLTLEVAQPRLLRVELWAARPMATV